jgi:hypothetical protein
MGGVVLLGCWVACHWQIVFVMDDVLDVVEGNAGETVIELTREENGIKES